MSRAKAAALMAMSQVDFAVYNQKRNQASYWRRFSHEEWVEFCTKMGRWFTVSAPDEFDKYTAANMARKAESDKLALERRGPLRPKRNKR